MAGVGAFMYSGVFLVGDASRRVQVARWTWKAERARRGLVDEFDAHGCRLVGEWCDFSESESFGREVEELGPSRDRVIQRWPDKRLVGEALGSLDVVGLPEERLVVHVADAPEAAWMEVGVDVVESALIPAATEWLVEGFVLYMPDRASLLGVDVEHGAAGSFIETTLIGSGFSALGAHLRACGPDPLPITGP